MSNFKFLLSEPSFASFADVAIAAEKILHIDPAACILNCRRSMEFAVKWMYSVDKELEMPYQDNLQSLMSREEFRAIVGSDLWQRMDFIRKKGNTAAHNTGKITEAVAMLCLENLHIFLDFVAYCYADEYTETKFDAALVPVGEIAVDMRTVGDAGPYKNLLFRNVCRGFWTVGDAGPYNTREYTFPVFRAYRQEKYSFTVIIRTVQAHCFSVFYLDFPHQSASRPLPSSQM